MNKYFLITLLLIVPIGLFASPWTCIPTTTKQVIKIPVNNLQSIDSYQLSEYDKIAVFYDSAGTEKCGGIAAWNPDTIVLYAYGKDSNIDNGFEIGEAFSFKVFLSLNNCILDIYYNQDDTLKPWLFEPGRTSILSFYNIYPKSVYFASSFCQFSGMAQPLISSEINDLRFSSSTGLIIHNKTGEINLNKSPAGEHLIQFESSYCLLSSSMTIKILPVDNAILGATRFICPGDSISISVPASARSIIWSDGTKDSSSITINASGNYRVEYTAENNCITRDTLTINMYTPVSSILGKDTAICFGDTIYKDLSLLTSSIEEISSPTTNNSSVMQITQGGIYSVVYHDIHHCPSSDFINILEYKPIRDVLVSDTTKCEEESIILQAPSYASNIQWSTGSSETLISCTNAGYFSLSFLDKNNCYITDGININNYPKPAFSLIEKHRCYDMLLSTDNPEYAYSWSTGEVGDSIAITTSSEISVEATDEHGCKSTQTGYFEPMIFQPGYLQFDVIDANCNGMGKVVFDTNGIINGTGPYTFSLFDENNEYPSTNYTIYIPTGSYNIKIKDARNCSSVSDKQVIINKTDDCEYPVFTPDGDGIDDDYFIETSGKIKVLDRWGQLLNEFEGPFVWNGSSSDGKILPMGSYILLFEDNVAVNITIIK